MYAFSKSGNYLEYEEKIKVGIDYRGGYCSTGMGFPRGGKEAHTSTRGNDISKSSDTQDRPKERDMLDYLCFLAKTGKLPRRAIGKMLKVSPSNVAKRAERGREWADHFLSENKLRPVEIPASQIKGFDLENVAG